MAKPGERATGRGLEVRGTVDVEKFKAARALGGEEVTFQLRAMKPNRASQALPPSCIVCLICIICVVCAAAKAEEFGIPSLAPLEG